MAVRLALGALWFAGLELLPWAAPAGRAPWEWPLLFAGYWALAAVLLDTAARYRLRDGFGMLALAGLAGLAAALLFNPAFALANPPLTWFTRALGALSLGALAGLLILIRLTQTVDRRTTVLAALFAVPLGAIWGYWAHWSPVALDPAAAPTPPEVILAAGAIGIGLILIALALTARFRSQPLENLLLPLPVLALLLLLLLGVLVLRVLNETVAPISAATLSTLGLVCLGVLYYQRRSKGPTRMDGLAQVPVPGWSRSALPASLAILIGAGLGANLPRGAPDSDLILILSAAITAFGFLWLPGVALVIAARAFGRLARTERL